MFRFRLLVTWSSAHGRDASSHKIWCRYLSSPELLSFFRNSRWWPPPSWIFILCDFDHSGVLIVWYLRSVPNLVQIFVIYSHWDRRIYVSDFHLMTSRELTSGFKFWSRGHIRMVAMHLSIKCGADIFICSRVIGIFPMFKMAATAILDLLGGGVNGPPTKAHSLCVQVIRVWIFCCSGLKVLFTPPKFSFMGILLPLKFGGILFRPLRDFTSFELSRVKIHPRVWPVGWSKKKRYK